MTWTKCEDGIPTGYREATYGDKPTHAICHHGEVKPISADSHDSD